MNYCLYKLKFNTSVHFGSSVSATSLESAKINFCADTLFSALCHISNKMGCINRFINLALQGDITFSDSMPYNDDTLFIPKPFVSIERKNQSSLENRKKIKKLDFIPVLLVDDYFNSSTDLDRMLSNSVKNDFGEFSLDAKVSLKDAQRSPYNIRSFKFNDNCGLYFLIGYKNKENIGFINDVITYLGLEGIGGKTSSGYGKFSICSVSDIESNKKEQYDKLNKYLTCDSSDNFISLTTSIPKDSELEDVINLCSYKLVRRAGFIFTDSLDKPVKKLCQYFFAAGSVSSVKYQGDIYNVGKNIPHPVYRYSKPIFLGV